MRQVATELRADFARREVVLAGGEAWRLSAHNPFTGPDGALIYVKIGHLAAAEAR